MDTHIHASAKFQAFLRVSGLSYDQAWTLLARWYNYAAIHHRRDHSINPKEASKMAEFCFWENDPKQLWSILVAGQYITNSGQITHTIIKNMKWFKHDTDAQDSEGLSWLVDKYGFEGYGRWFRILEIVASRMDETNNCEATYSASAWAKRLLMTPPSFRRWVVAVSPPLRGEVTETEKEGVVYVTVRIPNLLKKRDNYTTNLQVANKEQTTSLLDQDKEKEQEKEEEKSTSPNGEVSQSEPKTAPTDPLGSACHQFAQEWNQRACKDSPALKPITLPISEKRKHHLRARLGHEPLLRAWQSGDLWNAIAEQKFLAGNNQRGWLLDFDKLIRRQDIFEGIIERKYSNGPPGKQSPDSDADKHQEAREQLGKW